MPLSSEFESKLKSLDIPCLLSYPIYLPRSSRSEARERFDVALSKRKKNSALPTQNILCLAINSSGVEDPKSSGHFSTIKISPTPSCVDTGAAVVSCCRCPIVALYQFFHTLMWFLFLGFWTHLWLIFASWIDCHRLRVVIVDEW
jgi:hypothetical protein